MASLPESVATLDAIERQMQERLNQLQTVHIWCAIENKTEAKRSILRCKAVLAIIEAARADSSFPSWDLLAAAFAEIEAVTARPITQH